MTGAWQPWAVQHLKEAVDMGSAAMVVSALRRCGHLDLAEHQGAARPCSWGWGVGLKNAGQMGDFCWRSTGNKMKQWETRGNM